VITESIRVRPSRSGVLEGAVLVVVALACLGYQLWIPSTHIPESDYAAVAQVLSQEAQPGDVVLLAPWWAERARLFIPDGLPVVGYQGSDADALEGFGRIWLLTAPGLPRADVESTKRAFLPQRAPLGTPRVFGKVHLELYSNGRTSARLWSAQTDLASARVWVEQPDGTRQDCAWNGVRHSCPGGRGVQLEWHEVKFKPVQCVRFDPPGGEARLMLEIPAQPAGSKLVMEAGYIWDRGSFRDGMTATELALEVGASSHPISLPPGFEGLARAEVPVSAEGARARVWAKAVNPANREVCLTISAYRGTS
jgi:hypothetical protein